MFKKLEILVAIFFTVISLGIYIYIFGILDRKIVFLYGHLGLTPFDRMTIGRYWMTGLVLSGFFSILYLLIQLIIKYTIKNKLIFCKKIVKFITIPLIIGVVLIIMNLGEPKLSFVTAISSALALLFGIVVSFCVIDDFIKDARQTITYLIISIGLVPFLLLFRVLELPEKGILSMNFSVLIVIFSIIFGFIWLIITYKIFRQYRPKMINVIKGTLTIGYIELPLLHYLIATPKGIPYITSSDNFFADNIILRIINWFLLILIVYIVEKIDKKKAQWLTKAKIKRAESANFKGSTSNKLHRRLTVKCSEKPASF